ncbi:TPA: hypothetical protein OUD64_004452 [Enterobacter kobei]|uniref:hypothetical protein n=1 Tax=Enterobacter TaxID=547 RepID=UPI0021D261B1|nr:hypothetical protein [Enterobacter quasiroggenkampii]MCU6307709.1 hypothetical protein [Enterobacter quasiroggenkampii]HCT9943492.1 hypothetical protein [Enterobacter kobei]HCT9943780.1 hypothetical protein [Enterobacter kobei]
MSESILDKFEINENKLTEIINNNPSLRGMVLGYIAEDKFHELFLEDERVKEVSKDDDHDRKKKGDRTFVYKSKRFTVEVKSLQTAMCKKNEDGTFFGKAQVDGSDRRVVKFPDGSELNTTLLLKGEFDILAVNCFAFGEGWKFVFAKNADLPSSTFKKYSEEQRKQLIASLITVTWPPQPPFFEDPFPLLDELLTQPVNEISIEEETVQKEVIEEVDILKINS